MSILIRDVHVAQREVSFWLRALIWLLAIVAAFSVAALATAILTSGVSTFEGQRGYAFMLALPVVFLGVLIACAVTLRHAKRRGYKPRNVALSLLATSVASYILLVLFAALTSG